MKTDKSVRATETQILIGQMGKGLIVERLKICKELWDAGIKCETLYIENPKPQPQLTECFNKGIPLAMWIG